MDDSLWGGALNFLLPPAIAVQLRLNDISLVGFGIKAVVLLFVLKIPPDGCKNCPACGKLLWLLCDKTIGCLLNWCL
jgi:hypothetical protein